MPIPLFLVLLSDVRRRMNSVGICRKLSIDTSSFVSSSAELVGTWPSKEHVSHLLPRVSRLTPHTQSVLQAFLRVQLKFPNDVRLSLSGKKDKVPR